MKTLIAIGGGSFQKGETVKFDMLAIERSNKTNPHVLCIPAASNDDQGYAKRCKQYFRTLGCEASSLRLWHTKKSKAEVEGMIEDCDILYFGAGDTFMLMKALQNWDMINFIKQQYAKGKVMIGCSAGANILFTKGYSDTVEGFQFVDGIELQAGVFCPHAQREERKDFFTQCTETSLPLFPCDDGKAYVKIDDQDWLIMDNEKPLFF